MNDTRFISNTTNLQRRPTQLIVALVVSHLRHVGLVGKLESIADVVPSLDLIEFSAKGGINTTNIHGHVKVTIAPYAAFRLAAA